MRTKHKLWACRTAIFVAFIRSRVTPKLFWSDDKKAYIDEMGGEIVARVCHRTLREVTGLSLAHGQTVEVEITIKKKNPAKRKTRRRTERRA